MLTILLVALGAGETCPPQRAAPDKHCALDSDCVVLRQKVGCCGTVVIRAVNRNDVARLEDEARVCSSERCKCAPAPTTLDDGTPAEGNRKVGAVCRQSRCSPVLEPEAPPRAGLTSAEAAKLQRCSPQQCGPAPLYPTSVCPDGLSVEGRGPCVRMDGGCGWAHLVCP